VPHGRGPISLDAVFAYAAPFDREERLVGTSRAGGRDIKRPANTGLWANRRPHFVTYCLGCLPRVQWTASPFFLETMALLTGDFDSKGTRDVEAHTGSVAATPQ